MLARQRVAELTFLIFNGPPGWSFLKRIRVMSAVRGKPDADLTCGPPLPLTQCGHSLTGSRARADQGHVALAGIPANPTRRIAEASSEQAIEMRNIRKAYLQRNVGNQLRASARLG